MRWPRGLAHRIGHRGTVLLFLGVLDLIYAFSLFRPSPASRHQTTYLFLADIAPLWAWALLWAGVGLACFDRAFRRHDRVGFAAAIGLKVLWSLVFLGGWLAGQVDRGYLSAAVWTAFALLLAVISTWPEPPCNKAAHQ